MNLHTIFFHSYKQHQTRLDKTSRPLLVLKTPKNVRTTLFRFSVLFWKFVICDFHYEQFKGMDAFNVSIFWAGVLKNVFLKISFQKIINTLQKQTVGLTLSNSFCQLIAFLLVFKMFRKALFDNIMKMFVCKKMFYAIQLCYVMLTHSISCTSYFSR